MALPKMFKTNGGKIFPVKVVKVNHRTFVLELLGEPNGKGGNHKIKVSKRSTKLIWKET